MGDSDRLAAQLSELTSKYSEAQRNAQRAMALFKETRDENDVLKSNFEALKQVRLTGSSVERGVAAFCSSCPRARVLTGRRCIAGIPDDAVARRERSQRRARRPR
jgi:hypothetical protein